MNYHRYRIILKIVFLDIFFSSHGFLNKIKFAVRNVFEIFYYVPFNENNYETLGYDLTKLNTENYEKCQETLKIKRCYAR